jgi:hypothetical protein
MFHKYACCPVNRFPALSANMSVCSSDDESLPASILPIKFKSEYAVYESAPREVKFSEDFIAALTIGDCMEPDFHIPSALPDDFVKLVDWSTEEPAPASDHFLLIDSKVPSLADVRVFLGDQPARFRDGFRSVILEARGKALHDRDSDSQWPLNHLHRFSGMIYSVHFREARLWSNVGLLRDKVATITAIADTIRSQNLLNGDEYMAFLECPAATRLQGFPKRLSVPLLLTLQELLDENWIGERILDAQGHLIMQAVNDRHGPSTVLILPAYFHTQLSVAYRSKSYSTSLKTLRGSLLTNLPRFIAFIANKKLAHWAPCVISLEDRVVRQGDCLNWDSDEELLAKIEWLLGDITKVHGKWTEAKLDVPYQGSRSGSCGIVAFSAIHKFLLTDTTPWSTDLAAQFRHRWLGELVRHHLKAVKSSKQVRT